MIVSFADKDTERLAEGCAYRDSSASSELLYARSASFKSPDRYTISAYLPATGSRLLSAAEQDSTASASTIGIGSASDGRQQDRKMWKSSTITRSTA